MKRSVGTILLLAFLLSLLPAGAGEAEEVFTCGAYDYTLDADGGAVIARCREAAPALTVPAEVDGHPVKAIGDGAFNFRSQLVAVTIPDSVTGVGTNPWCRCDSLTSLCVSPSHPTLAVIDGILYHKSDRRLICCPPKKTGALEIPRGIRSIGENAFWECAGLTSVTLPDTLEHVGSRAFYRCAGLTSVLLPDALSKVGENPWQACGSLSSILVSPGNGSLRVIGGALCTADGTRLICFPAARQGAFDIPEGIKIIGENAFYSCAGLTSVTIPGTVTAIGDGAFAWCAGLKAVTVPDSVTAVGAEAFYCCESLERITLPDSLASLGESALGGTGLISAAIPAGIGVLSEGLFCECERLAAVTLPDTLTAIGGLCFDGCTSLMSVRIPDGVEAIGEYAFFYCESLVSLTVPEGVGSIGEEAFGGCPLLTLTVAEGSYAEGYCAEAGLPYAYPDALDWLE